MATVHSIISDVYNIVKFIKRLDRAEGDFLKEMEENEQVRFHVHRIQDEVETNQTRCKEDKQAFLHHRSLWAKNIDATLQIFLNDEDGMVPATLPEGAEAPPAGTEAFKVPSLANFKSKIDALKGEEAEIKGQQKTLLANMPVLALGGEGGAQDEGFAATDDKDKEPSPICVVQLLQLPGINGSLFQFRALEACFKPFEVQVQPISMETLEDAQASKEVLGDFIDEDLVGVMGYSAGAGLVPSFVRWTHNANTKCDATIIMDPPISNVTLPPDLGHRLIATSVLGTVPANLDVDMLERALVTSFPSDGARFASARKFLSMARARRIEPRRRTPPPRLRRRPL